MAFGEEAGPYEDEPGIAYVYDDQVQNHKQVAVDDLLFVRNREYLEGIGRIVEIERSEGEKTLLRCPICETGRVHLRKETNPSYRCKLGHEFASPAVEIKRVKTYKALFSGTWLRKEAEISVLELRLFELRNSKQMAIMPADLKQLCGFVASRWPTAAGELMRWTGSIGHSSGQ